MTEIEAFEAFIAKWNSEKKDAGLTMTDDEHDCAEEAWYAALAWLRSQGEVVAHGIGPGDWTYTISSPVRVGAKLFIAPQPAWRKVDDEIESGVGIRWVSDTGIHGRPTAHDVREYLERRGESAKCGCDKCTAPQPAIPDEWQSNAARDVLAERIRQMENEGWTHLHDDEHSDGSMAQAAACYALGAATDNPDRHVMDRFGIEGTPYRIHSLWPWDRKWFKPHSRRRDLVKAAALILAEIERLDRKMLAAAPEPSK